MSVLHPWVSPIKHYTHKKFCNNMNA